MINLTDYEQKTMVIFNCRDEVIEISVTDPYQIQALNRLVKRGYLKIDIKPIIGGKIYRKVNVRGIRP